MPYANQNNDPVGYADLFESKPEFKSVLYGKMQIPLELIDAAIAANHVREIKGNSCVELAIEYYPFDREWKFQGAAPVLSGRITKKKEKGNFSR